MGSNLETFTTEFKRDCLAFFLNDSLAAKTALPKIPDNFFDFDIEYAIIFHAFKEFVEKYKSRPSSHELIGYITDWCNRSRLEESKLRSVLRVLDEVWAWTSYNPAYVREKLYDAIKAHEIFQVARQLDSFIDEGKFDELVTAFAKARSCVSEEPEVIEYWTDADDRMTRITDPHKNVISTSMPPVDELLGGGLARGGLGMIMAGSGKGKTALLGQLGVQASLMGYTTAYVTLEAGPEEIMKRCDAHNTGIKLQDIPMAKMKKKLQKKLFDVYASVTPNPASFFIQYFPSKTVGVSQIENYVTRLREEQGRSLDLLIVDYFDLLKMEGSYTKRYEALEENIEVLRGLAGRFDMAIWTASQVNRGGLKEETVDMDSIAGGFGKVFPLDLLITISQTKEEKAQNVYRFFFAKNRYGPGGAVVYVDHDFERMRFTALTKEEVEQRDLGPKKSTKTVKKASQSSYTGFGA